MGKSGLPGSRTDRGNQRREPGDRSNAAAAPEGKSAAKPSNPSQGNPLISPEQSSGANASPMPGKDERRNRSI